MSLTQSPPATQERNASFAISHWRPHAKNTLLGFCSLTLPSGLVLHDCTIHTKNGIRWVSLPARRYEKDGKVSYSPLIDFTTSRSRQRFQALALDAVDCLLGACAR
jgi:DNA-binding cell septation regulator SpoVG